VWICVCVGRGGGAVWTGVCENVSACSSEAEVLLTRRSSSLDWNHNDQIGGNRIIVSPRALNWCPSPRRGHAVPEAAARVDTVPAPAIDRAFSNTLAPCTHTLLITSCCCCFVMLKICCFHWSRVYLCMVSVGSPHTQTHTHATSELIHWNTWPHPKGSAERRLQSYRDSSGAISLRLWRLYMLFSSDTYNLKKSKLIYSDGLLIGQFQLIWVSEESLGSQWQCKQK